jgi:hypothetical protein
MLSVMDTYVMLWVMCIVCWGVCGVATAEGGSASAGGSEGGSDGGSEKVLAEGTGFRIFTPFSAESSGVSLISPPESECV